MPADADDSLSFTFSPLGILSHVARRYYSTFTQAATESGIAPSDKAAQSFFDLFMESHSKQRSSLETVWRGPNAIYLLCHPGEV